MDAPADDIRITNITFNLITYDMENMGILSFKLGMGQYNSISTSENLGVGCYHPAGKVPYNFKLSHFDPLQNFSNTVGVKELIITKIYGINY